MDLNELLDKIDDELFADNIDTEIVGDKIIWRDNFHTENYVDIKYTDYSGCKFAWWQFNSSGKDIVRVCNGDFIHNWRPKLNNMGGTLGCIYLKFYENLLFVAYPDKDGDRLYAFDTKQVKTNEVHYCGIIGVCIYNDLLFVKDYNKKEVFYMDLKLPLLEKVNISEEEVRNLGIKFDNKYGMEI
ncbi:MAG: hypothetical protein ACOVRN_06235 [Flavobacterium sp.]